MRICKLGGCNTFLIRGIWISIFQVLHNRSGKQIDLLQYDTEGCPQILLADLINVDSVVPDLTIVYIIETIDQIGDRRFSCSGRTYKCDLLTRFRIERHITQNLFDRIVTEIHMIQNDIAL